MRPTAALFLVQLETFTHCANYEDLRMNISTDLIQNTQMNNVCLTEQIKLQ